MFPYQQGSGLDGAQPPSLNNAGNLDNSQYQHQAPYQVAPIIPAKRNRPGDDSLNATPSSHATPSPIPHQQFHTNGPSQPPTSQPFSPQFGGPQHPFASIQPPMQNNQNRMNSPHNAGPQNYMRGVHPGSQGLGTDSMVGPPVGMHGNPSFSGAAGPGMQPGMHPGFAQDSRQQYQMRLMHAQQQLQGGPMNPQNRAMPNAMDPAQAAMAARANGQARAPPMTPMNAQRPGLKAADNSQANAFMQSLRNFMMKSNRQLNPEPKVCGRPIAYWSLFQLVARGQPGSSPNRWTQLANTFGFPEQQFPNAATELKSVYDQNLADFVVRYMQTLQEKRAQAMQQGQQPPGQFMAPQMSPTQPRPPFDRGPPPPGSSGSGFQQQPGGSANQSPSLQDTSSMTEPGGFSTPPHQPGANVADTQGPHGHRKSSSALSQLPSPNQFPNMSPFQGSAGTPQMAGLSGSPALHGDGSQRLPSKAEELDTNYEPRSDAPFTYGGYLVGRRVEDDAEDTSVKQDRLAELGEEVGRMKSSYPMHEDLGLVDIHGLTMALQSGFHNEITYALDRVIALASRPLDLAACEDLIEVLVECGQEQLDTLSDASPQSSESISIPSFEDLVNSSAEDLHTIAIKPAFGEPEYELEHAVDRLGAITTTFCHMSFPGHIQADPNRHILAGPVLISFLSDLFRQLGTRENLFRSPSRALDIMKDLITFLSNIAQDIELSSEEDASCLLHFLLAFAPIPTAATPNFRPYEPNKHHYLPCAVDTLGKILARDDPNRMFYKSIFQSENQNSGLVGALPKVTNEELVATRAFALAVSPIPFRGIFSEFIIEVCERRKPFLSQGMLAANVLASLPSTTPSLARSWLDPGGNNDENDWAPRLMRLILEMASFDVTLDQRYPPERDPRNNALIRPDPEVKGFCLITRQAPGMIRKLVEKAEQDLVLESAAPKGPLVNGDVEKHDMRDASKAEQVDGAAGDDFRQRLRRLIPNEKLQMSLMIMWNYDNEVMKHFKALGAFDR